MIGKITAKMPNTHSKKKPISNKHSGKAIAPQMM